MSVIFTTAVPDVDEAKSLVKSTSIACRERRAIERVAVSKVARASVEKRVEERKIDAESVVVITSDALRVVNTTRAILSAVFRESLVVLT